MLITLEIDAASQQRLRQLSGGLAHVSEALAHGLEAALAVGAQEVQQYLQEGRSGLTMRHPASGLAASVMGWLADPIALMGYLGVPGNSPAAQYAGILERGGTIVPKAAKALAVPVSAEAKLHTSPRDMADLVMIPRKGRPPLLVRMLSEKSGEFEVHWVLLSSVTIPAFHWLSNAVDAAVPAMTEAFQDVVSSELT